MRNWFWLAPAALLGSPVVGYATVYLTVEQAQMAIFPSETLTAVPKTLTREEQQAMERAGSIRVRNADVRAWRTAGGDWFIVDEVLGKHEFITYAVGISAAGAVRGVEIMEYRETYGDQVRNPKWRAQFLGKTKLAPLKLDADIQNLSGATLSSRHVTDGVKRLLILHDLVLRHS